MSTPFDGLSHSITLDKAIQMTTLYREQKDKILNPEYQGTNILPIAESFNRQAIDRLLAQRDCVGIRLYNSMNENLQLHTIIVGVNSNNEDILPTNTKSGNTVTFTLEDGISGPEGGEIVEEAVVCPPTCNGGESPLNP